MKTRNILLAGVIALFGLSAAAQVGAPYIHDPSTIMVLQMALFQSIGMFFSKKLFFIGI